MILASLVKNIKHQLSEDARERFEGPLSGSQDAVAGVLNDPDDSKTKAIAMRFNLSYRFSQSKIARDLIVCARKTRVFKIVCGDSV